MAKALSIWDYYQKSEDGRAVTCLLCAKVGKVKKYAYSGGNGTLLHHLKKRHAKEHDELVGVDPLPKGQPTLHQTFPKPVDFRAELTKMVVMAHLPLNFIENEHFRSFLAAIGVRFTCPCRKTVTESLIPALANDMRSLVGTAVKAAHAFSVSVDLWTSAAKDHCVGCAAHLVDKNWETKTVFVGIRALPERADHMNITSALTDLFQKIGIDLGAAARDGHLFSLASDGGGNLRCCADQLGVCQPCH